jgi:hypothetical protein
MSNVLVEPSVLCPYIAGGSFLSVDSHEIDATLTIRYLVDKYINQKDWTKPLAIGVFGKPGSGKSSVVRNILSSNADCLLDPSLECNLSQLSSLDALARHFHKVQDMTQREKVPVVFFDEFDSTFDGKPVGWLRYFLMPIQDGMYASANDNYHIGKSVFIFAGGVADTFADFRKRFESREEDKVRDFISRLRGYIDVQDVSFPESLKRRYASSEFVFTVKNRAIQIRRAVILRDLLRRNLRQIFDEGSQTARINKAVVNAFLYVPKYLHGIRSMEAIIQMSRVSSRASSYQPSALPPKSQLAMHVDADSFLRFANEHPQ